MKTTTASRTERIIKALRKGNLKPLRCFTDKLLAESRHKLWSEQQLQQVQTIVVFCMEHSYNRQAQKLIKAGADKSIRDQLGRRPKDMPKEKYRLLSAGLRHPLRRT